MNGKAGKNILALLHQVQRESERNYLRDDNLRQIAEQAGLPYSEVYGVATFYSMFSLTPRGRNIIRVCESGPCHLEEARFVLETLKKELNLDVGQTTADGTFTLETTSCLGHCDEAPVMMINEEVYGRLTAEKVREILVEYGSREEGEARRGGQGAKPPGEGLSAGQGRPPQQRIVLENCGQIDPERIEEYIARGGYEAARQALTAMTPQEVIAVVRASGLRGRGGAGFPTGRKWEFAAQAPGPVKYLICNADEGEPGTFKDRLILEGDPHKIIEGMILAGYATGAQYGVIYIRGEYALALGRVKKALAQATASGFLGEALFGQSFNFQIEVREGAGSYVCGEETALIESVEGKRGRPRLRPPFPATVGLWGKPTTVNNVETLANIPPIIRHGAEWFRRFGTGSSPGTKVFCLSGHVQQRGAVEVPLGVTLRQLIDEYGGGMRGGKFKMAQLGGTAGAFLAEEMLDGPLDYDALLGRGAVLGSGALLVMNETTCVVDMLRCCFKFFLHECCGQCVPGRVGTKKLYEVISQFAAGTARSSDLLAMDRIVEVMQKASLCAGGQSLSLPFRSAVKYFRPEILEHTEGICRTGRCPMAGTDPMGEVVRRKI